MTTEKVLSPDRSLVAVVMSANHESVIEVRTDSGKVLATRDYRSSDGEHGFGVVKAEWTPDSKFFVYSLENSGGHQPWHTPVQYFSRQSEKILSVDDALDDAVTNPQFAIEAPDSIAVELYFQNKLVKVSLSSLNRESRFAK